MAKKDDITLIIAKAFSEQDLTAEEKVLCCDLTITKLVSEHGLNDIQSNHVVNWCAIQQAKTSNQIKKEVLEEGIFSFLNRRKKKKVEKIFKDIFTNKQKSVGLTDFLKDVSYLIKAIKNEKGISDYRTKEDNYLPSGDYNVQRIQKITRVIFTLNKEFERFGIKSAKRVTESLETKDLNQKAISMNIKYKLDNLEKYGYYNADMTTVVRPFLNAVKKHYGLTPKETQQLSGRFALFTSNLLDDLREQLNVYKDAVEHGKLTLSREHRPPVKYSNE
jgi:hypothetical protein